MAVEAYSVDKLHEAVLEYIDKKDSIPKEVKEEARYRNSKERMARIILKCIRNYIIERYREVRV